MDKSIDTHAANKALNHGVDAASSSMHKAIDAASEAVTPAIKQISSTAHNTVDKMASGANYAAEAIANKGSQLNNLQQQFTEGARSKVRNHPLLLLGIAVATGAALSMWLGHKKN